MTYFNINNISTPFWNDGIADINAQQLNSGFVYPKGTHKTAIFISGFLWGAKVGGQIRVGGSVYSSGMQGGKIVSPGTAEDPNLSKNRIYRVRPDYITGDLSSEVSDEGISADAIRTQYARDWDEWPAADGAPFDDRNGNGLYEPTTDVPGVKGAGQTIWFVCNDLDSVLVHDLYGSPPIGIEMQVTIWGYNQPAPIGNMIFKSYLLINKSGEVLDSMFVSQWSDPDVGNSTDDYAGCDTTSGLGFAYNAFLTDALYAPLAPPAVGFGLLQGPIVPSPGRTARFRGRDIGGFRNVPMTSFFFAARGDALVMDPIRGDYTGTLEWYNFMQGRIGKTGGTFVDPYGVETPFTLAGDPLAGTGWIDGQLLPAGDRRISLASGPFQMAAGDTQEVVVAQLAAGAMPRTNYRSAISLVKSYMALARTVHASFYTAIPPTVHASVRYVKPTKAEATVTAEAGASRAASMSVEVMSRDGLILGSAPLFDDGTNGDTLAGDRIFTNAVWVDRQMSPGYVTVTVTDSSSKSYRWERVIDRIVLVGPLTFSSAQIFSDNLNSDGQANPGENVRYGFSIGNPSAFPLRGLLVQALPETYTKTVHYDSLAAWATIAASYNPADPSTYYSADIPSPFADTLFTVEVTIADAITNTWITTCPIRVHQLSVPMGKAIVTHAFGPATGDFDILVIDPAAVRNDRYSILGVTSIDTLASPGFTLVDSTDGRVLLLNHPLPDEFAHNIPVTDGFKVTRGSIEFTFGWKDWAIPSGSRRWTWAGAEGWGLEGFNGAMGMAYNNWFSSSTVTPDKLRNVLIKLADTDAKGNLTNPDDPNASYGYRYLRRAAFPPALAEFTPYIVNPGPGYAFQDFKKGSVPFAAFDEDDGNKRLAVGFHENNTTDGLVDGKYWPGASDDGVNNVNTREMFFIFDVPYSTTQDPALAVDLLTYSLPIMWWGAPNRRGANTVRFQAGDEFLIIVIHPPSSGDIWTFNPTQLVGVPPDNGPLAFELSQNYPNPFNPTTTIRYQLPGTSRISIRIYNILGQQIRNLVDGIEVQGSHTSLWDGRNDHGVAVSGGVYFYRIESRMVDESQSLAATKKMLLVK